MMKRLMTVLAFGSLTMTTLAQETVPVQKYSVATNSFWSNWFVQVGGDYNAWYSNQEHGLGLDNGDHYGLFAKQRRTFGASVAVGKWFSPGFGLRTKLQLGKAKKVGMVGVSKLDYWTLNEHLLFNMSNLLCGYNPDRVWNVTPFIGGGVTRNESISLYAMQLSVGINSSWKLSRLLDLYAEVGWNRMEDDFDGYEGYNQRAKHHGYGWEDKDNNLYAEIGLTFKLGKSGWNKTPDVDALKSMSQSQIDDLNNKIKNAKAEGDRLRNELAQTPKDEVQIKSFKEFITTPISVFFNINRTELARLKDLVNVRALAKYAVENNSRMLVTGYADSATGTPAINQRLSEARAKILVDELVKMGVNRSNISVAAGGGVKILEYPSYDRRATVQIVE